MALPVIKYQPQRPGADLNSLPRSFSGNVPLGGVNAPKLGYNPPGATMNKPPKPRPPVGGVGEPTDPRYVGPPIKNPVPDRTPDYANDRGTVGPTPGTPPPRVNYNPSAPTNPPAGPVPWGQNPAGDNYNPRGNNDPYGKTGPFIPVPNPGGIVSNPTTGTPAPGPFPPMPEPTQPTPPGGVPTAGVDRTQETLAERLQRLRDLRAGGGGGENLGARIHALNQRIAGGAVNPKNYDPNRPPQEPPNDFPTSTATMKQGDLAELAPPVGYATFFRDQGKSAALTARKEKIKANAGVEPTKKKKKGGGGGAAAEATETPTNQAEAKGKNKGKLTDKQKKRMKRRPQPGTPERPYISRGVTYAPVGFGGSLRV